jgi:hypothetical protein
VVNAKIKQHLFNEKCAFLLMSIMVPLQIMSVMSTTSSKVSQTYPFYQVTPPYGECPTWPGVQFMVNDFGELEFVTFQIKKLAF